MTCGSLRTQRLAISTFALFMFDFTLEPFDLKFLDILLCGDLESYLSFGHFTLWSFRILLKFLFHCATLWIDIFILIVVLCSKPLVE